MSVRNCKIFLVDEMNDLAEEMWTQTKVRSVVVAVAYCSSLELVLVSDAVATFVELGCTYWRRQPVAIGVE